MKKLAGVSTLVVALLLAAGPAAAKPGDLIVGDSDAGSVLRIDPNTGAQSVIADDFGDALPDGIAFDKRGNILVAAYENGVEDDAVFRIARNGAISPLTSGPPLGQPTYLDYSPDGKLYVADPTADTLFKLNPLGGEPVPFADVSAPAGIEVAHDASLFASGTDGVVRVNRQNGAAIDIAPGLPGVFGGMTLAPNGILFQASETDESVYRINPRARTFTPIVDQSAEVDNAYDIAIHPNGFLYLTNFDESVATIERVDPSTGALTEIASQSDPGSFLDFPEGIEVEPPRCGGLVANIVGSNEKDRLSGSKFADVISGLGGNDVIRGLRGNDRLCGGNGRDKLRGGPGNDRLFGQRGRDRLKGGPGRDRERQ